MEYTALQVVWFVLIAILWIGYFVLEGFDFGVGILLRVIGRTTAERRAVIHTIGPVWDGNEVWLITAGGATFAAFPQWYATLFSGFYLALFAILLALIVRGVSFEFWGKHDTQQWRDGWEWCMAVGSGLAALLWGVAWANIVPYHVGKAANVAPPAMTSQTSLPSQTGPIVSSIAPRSRSSRGRKGSSIPTPKSKPSRTK